MPCALLQKTHHKSIRTKLNLDSAGYLGIKFFFYEFGPHNEKDTIIRVYLSCMLVMNIEEEIVISAFLLKHLKALTCESSSVTGSG